MSVNSNPELVAGAWVRYRGVVGIDELNPGDTGRISGFGAGGHVFIRWDALGVQDWTADEVASGVEIIEEADPAAPWD